MTGDPDKDEDLIEMFAPLKLDEASLVIMPVNDNTNPLLISKSFISNTFYRWRQSLVSFSI